MRVLSRLPAFRAQAESLMTDTCTITRAGAGDPVFDETTGQYTDPPRVTVYSGKCKVQIVAQQVNATSGDAGAREVISQALRVDLPVVGTEGVAVNDAVEVTESRFDAALVGRKFTVTARHDKSQATARRLPVREVTG